MDYRLMRLLLFVLLFVIVLVGYNLNFRDDNEANGEEEITEQEERLESSEGERLERTAQTLIRDYEMDRFTRDIDEQEEGYFVVEVEDYERVRDNSGDVRFSIRPFSNGKVVYTEANELAFAVYKEDLCAVKGFADVDYEVTILTADEVCQHPDLEDY